MSYLASGGLNDRSVLMSDQELDLLPYEDQEDLLNYLNELADAGLLEDEGQDYFGHPGGKMFGHVLWSCIKPSIRQMMTSLVPLLLICVCQQAVIFLFKPSTSKANRMYILTGLAFMVYQFELARVAYLWSFTTSVYLAYLLLTLVTRARLVQTYFFILVAIVSEVLAILIFDKGFDTVRAVTMILTMKSISFVYYLNEAKKGLKPGRLLWSEFVSYNGYLWNLSTSVHGPWIDVNQHVQSISRQQLSFVSLGPVVGFFKSLACSSIALVCSNCLFDLLKENVEPNSLIDLYMRAISFRFSNYFICFYTQSLLTINKIPPLPLPPDSPTITSILGVVNPLEIELPRSLSYVVTNWNLPMHAWLKKFVFVPTSRSHGLFASIFFTYFISSLLHGSNVKIALVLLSFGFLTYSEYGFRRKLSKLTDSCVASKRCRPDCGHKRKATSLLALVINGLFYVLNVYHLIYLGQIFAMGDDFHGSGEEINSVIGRIKHDLSRVLAEWSSMGFMSHKLNAVLLIASFVMPN